MKNNEKARDKRSYSLELLSEADDCLFVEVFACSCLHTRKYIGVDRQRNTYGKSFCGQPCVIVGIH